MSLVPTETDKAFERGMNVCGRIVDSLSQKIANLESERSELIELIELMRLAIGEHNAPNDCYSTGPLSGNPVSDLVACPACSAIAKYDAVMRR